MVNGRWSIDVIPYSPLPYSLFPIPYSYRTTRPLLRAGPFRDTGCAWEYCSSLWTFDYGLWTFQLITHN
jgi:hypothetical protein